MLAVSQWSLAASRFHKKQKAEPFDPAFLEPPPLCMSIPSSLGTAVAVAVFDNMISRQTRARRDLNLDPSMRQEHPVHTELRAHPLDLIYVHAISNLLERSIQPPK